MTTRSTGDPTVAVLAHLIERIADRDIAAISVLYELTAANLYAVALRILRRREFAEEVLQDAFVNVWRFASGYNNSVSAPMVWMAVIVRNRAFDYLRRRKALAGPEIEWSDMLDDLLATETPDPYEMAVSDENARHLSICMNRLDVNQGRALELAYFYDLTHREVAEQMNAPLGTVKAWIRRGTEALKISLEVLDGTATSTPCLQKNKPSSISPMA
jgi:RNA polymerase sigma-70 factor (ECF subfamily)